MKRTSFLLACALLAGGVHAAELTEPAASTEPSEAPGQPVTEASQPAMTNPAVALRAGVDRLLDFLGQDPAPEPDQLAGFLDAEIAPFFDFDYMAQAAGGRMFARLDEAQQGEIREGIKSSFLGKMAEKLVGYSDQQVRFLPPRLANDGRTAEISVAILNPGQYPARLDFRLYRGADDWRVFDVAANGQSAIVHYRRELMREMRQQRMRQMRARMGDQMPQSMSGPMQRPMQGPMPGSMAPPTGPQGMPGPRPMMPPTGYGMPYSR
jgi:phospholipid transport system substrate-binding protein